MSDFFNQVYEVVKQIPPGRVTSYGAIAASIGSPGAARMVGWAMNASHAHHEYVPAHRVVNRNGLLTGKHHFDNPNAMKELLEAEGLHVQENRILDFNEKFWDPLTEIE
ncbi:MGMT family protein [uncultured Draconibacterium sp.]|uniref:MGMT family protein n=1 Tax=uncultured Draconibacterium sp. TaxID=1573823 RepID=UPI0025D81ADC|nr:MGMT family protein [uncultured Draconibacterium sp.]